VAFSNPPTRTELLDAELQTLVEWWLIPHCAPPCTALRNVPIKMLVTKRRIGHVRLRALLEKLRCEHCGGRPFSAEITDSVLPASTYPDRCAKWCVQVLP
jgi:hypothetical protein